MKYERKPGFRIVLNHKNVRNRPKNKESEANFNPSCMQAETLVLLLLKTMHPPAKQKRNTQGIYDVIS